jgi:hypothetical protein
MGKHIISYVLLIIGIVIVVAAAFLDVGALTGIRGIFLGLAIILTGIFFNRRGK